MTKELSKQLCELCGVEGKWIEYETETTDGCINLGSRLHQTRKFCKIVGTYHEANERTKS